MRAFNDLSFLFAFWADFFFFFSFRVQLAYTRTCGQCRIASPSSDEQSIVVTCRWVFVVQAGPPTNLTPTNEQDTVDWNGKDVFYFYGSMANNHRLTYRLAGTFGVVTFGVGKGRRYVRFQRLWNETESSATEIREESIPYFTSESDTYPGRSCFPTHPITTEIVHDAGERGVATFWKREKREHLVNLVVSGIFYRPTKLTFCNGYILQRIYKVRLKCWHWVTICRK